MSARGTPHATDPSQDHRYRGPEAVRIRMLGGFTVSVGPRTIRQDEWRSKKAAALLKLLALAPGRRMHRERAMELLWPESGKKAASNNLRQVLYGARMVLDPASGTPGRYLGLRDEHLVLCPGGQLWVDADAFEEAAFTTRRSGDPVAYKAATGGATATVAQDSSTYAEAMGDLTPREREVANLVARGLTNRQIATELTISERTAANHVAKILKKLGLESRTQIASWAAQHLPLAPDQ